MKLRRNAATTAQHPVLTDSDVCGLAAELVGQAIRRQLWLLFLDREDRPVPLLIPIDDVPEQPSDEGLAALVGLACGAAREAEAVQLIVVWERPGGVELSVEERELCARLESAYPVEPEEGDDSPALRLRAQVLACSDGVALV